MVKFFRMLKNLTARSLAVEKKNRVEISNSFQNVDMSDHHTQLKQL